MSETTTTAATIEAPAASPVPEVTPSAAPRQRKYDNTCDLPTDTRIKRVGSVLNNNPEYKSKLSNRKISVPCSKVEGNAEFPAEVVEVARCIHKAGRDACTIKGDEILVFAKGCLGDSSSNGNGNGTVAVPVAVTQPKPKAKMHAASKIVRIQKILDGDPALSERVESTGGKSITLHCRGGAEALVSKAAVEIADRLKVGGAELGAVNKNAIISEACVYFNIAKSKAEPAVHETVVEPKLEAAPSPAVKSAPKDTAKDNGSGPKVDWLVAVFSLLAAADQTATNYDDKLPGYEKRREAISKAMDEYLKMFKNQ